MNRFFQPRSIAVVGATAHPAKGGSLILRNLLNSYRHPIYPINPNYHDIFGLICYPSLRDVPGPIDLAIIFVPAAQVPRVMEDCIAKGVRGAMIESGGFAETGKEGAENQLFLSDLAVRTGIRIWGPNCMGLVDATRRHIFSFWNRQNGQTELLVGPLSLIVQSGMLSAGFLTDIMSRQLVGISKVCSIGNKVDVDECDLMAYLADDPETGVIGLYLESFKRGRLFLDLCRRSAKPIVLLKGGKSDRGAQAALSHTASLAGNHRVAAGCLRQFGVVEAYDFRHLIDLCRSLTITVRPAHRSRVAVLTFSGGAGIVSVDAMESSGLQVADLGEETRRTLQEIFPPWMPAANPVDLWPAMERHAGDGLDVTLAALETVLKDPAVDTVLLHGYTGSPLFNLDIPRIGALMKETGKAVFIWMMGEREKTFAFQDLARREGIVVFEELSRAVECLAAVCHRS